MEENSHILEAKSYQQDTPPHLKPTAPFSSYPDVEFFLAYKPSYDGSCTLAKKKNLPLAPSKTVLKEKKIGIHVWIYLTSIRQQK